MALMKNRKRIYFKELYSVGSFSDGRIKLDVLFRSDNGSEFLWTPRWSDVVNLTAAAKYIEETNKPRSEWTKELEKSYEELEEKKRIVEAANLVSATLGPLWGDKAINHLFQIPSELKGKSEQIFFMLSNAKDLDDFKAKLRPIVNVHKNHFEDEKFKEDFSTILKNLDLKLDGRMNIVKA